MTILDRLSPESQSQLIKERLLRRASQRRQLTEFADPIEWIQENFYIPETNRPMELYPSQAEPLKEALSMNESGSFRYSTVCWSAIKKSAKSSIAAAVGMWFAFQNPWSSVKVVANSLRQANSRSYYYCTRAIRLNPHWNKTCTVNKNTIELPNGSKITAVPLNPDTEAGGGDDFVMYTEIWAWRHDAALRMWTETTLSPLMYGRSLRWAEGYAGYLGMSPILEQLHETGVENGQLINEDYQMYRNQAARQFTLWQTKPHLPWQTKEYYAQEAATLTEPEFRRVHKNEWITSTDAFVPPEWWDACQADLPPLDSREPIVISMDAGVSGDCFGMSAVSRHIIYKDDGTVASDITKVRYGRKWEPPADGKIIYSNPQDKHDREYPEGELRWLISNYNVIAVVYDEYQLHEFVQRIRFENIAHFKVFGQGKDRAIADKQLYDCIRERNILHNGNPAITEHIKNANQEQVGDNKLRLVKRAPNMKIDLAVCVSMANATIRKMNY